MTTLEMLIDRERRKRDRQQLENQLGATAANIGTNVNPALGQLIGMSAKLAKQSFIPQGNMDNLSEIRKMEDRSLVNAAKAQAAEMSLGLNATDELKRKAAEKQLSEVYKESAKVNPQGAEDYLNAVEELKKMPEQVKQGVEETTPGTKPTQPGEAVAKPTEPTMATPELAAKAEQATKPKMKITGGKFFDMRKISQDEQGNITYQQPGWFFGTNEGEAGNIAQMQDMVNQSQKPSESQMKQFEAVNKRWDEILKPENLSGEAQSAYTLSTRARNAAQEYLTLLEEQAKSGADPKAIMKSINMPGSPMGQRIGRLREEMKMFIPAMGGKALNAQEMKLYQSLLAEQGFAMMLRNPYEQITKIKNLLNSMNDQISKSYPKTFLREKAVGMQKYFNKLGYSPEQSRQAAQSIFANEGLI
jgi:hypothetical protein